MTNGQKAMIGGGLLLVLAVGGEFAFLYHRNHADDTAKVTKPAYKSDPDDLVFLKHEHPMSFKDSKDMKGRTLWVSAAGQMDFYPYNGHAVDYEHTQGVLLGADKLLVKDAVEQAAPKKAAFRIPQGDKQVLLLFTHGTDTKEYAVPVGFRQDGTYTYSTDEIFFYDDPHTLFNYWGADIWKAIDEHRAINGMTEREVQLALGQVSDPHGDTVGERSVQFDNQGQPKMVTFRGGKAVSITEMKQ